MVYKKVVEEGRERTKQRGKRKPITLKQDVGYHDPHPEQDEITLGLEQHL